MIFPFYLEHAITMVGIHFRNNQFSVAHSAGAAEYTDSISTERYHSPNVCPGYDTKQFDGEASVMLEFGECRVPLYCHHF